MYRISSMTCRTASIHSKRLLFSTARLTDKQTLYREKYEHNADRKNGRFEDGLFLMHGMWMCSYYFYAMVPFVACWLARCRKYSAARASVQGDWPSSQYETSGLWLWSTQHWNWDRLYHPDSPWPCKTDTLGRRENSIVVVLHCYISGRGSLSKLSSVVCGSKAGGVSSHWFFLQL